MLGYLDAGSGSMVVGAVAAAGAGVAVAAKVGWRRVTGAFSRKGGRGDEPTSTASSVTENVDEAPVDGD